jgi:hypothetical protein
MFKLLKSKAEKFAKDLSNMERVYFIYYKITHGQNNSLRYLLENSDREFIKEIITEDNDFVLFLSDLIKVPTTEILADLKTGVCFQDNYEKILLALPQDVR